MNESDKKTTTIDRSKWNYIFLILAVGLGSVLYRLIVHKRLEQTAALFIGLPTVLAILLALTPKTKTAKGGIMKGLTLFLLLSGPLLGEGFICIVMASPVFYLVGILVGIVVDWGHKKNQPTLPCLLLFLLPMSIEGGSEKLSFDRSESVQASREVAATVEDVNETLSQSPRIGTRVPAFGRMGFPLPTQAWGEGLTVGSLRTIHFAGGEGRPGDLTLRVAESRPGFIRFEAVSDRSKIAHWLDWKSSEVEWKAIDAEHTRVTWIIHFERRLDPAWYFRPWERYATRLAADYLIRANATPASAKLGE